VTLISGTVPALQASATDLNEALKDESRGSSSLRAGRLSRFLVVSEIALSCGLLVGAGIMVRTLVSIRTVDFGFATEDVLTARTGLMENDYPDDAGQARFYRQLQERLEAQPGVLGAALADNLPTGGMGGLRAFAMEGVSFMDERDYPQARYRRVTPGYFETLGVVLRQGREFMWSDDLDAVGVAIVNESFAELHFQGSNAIGKRMRASGNPNADQSEWPWLTIVGVVPDMFAGGYFIENPQGFYLPLSQGPRPFFNILLRTRGDPLSFVPMLREQVFAMDPHLPVYWVWTMAQDFRDDTVFWVIWGTLFLIFGFVALFLAAIGLYGVMAFSVSMRTREIGLRMALGATTESVLKLVLKQGVTQLALGITIGLGIAAGLSRVIGSLLQAVEPWDPAVFVVIVLTLGLVGLLACLVPARRAASIEPMSALRHD